MRLPAPDPTSDPSGAAPMGFQPLHEHPPETLSVAHAVGCLAIFLLSAVVALAVVGAVGMALHWLGMRLFPEV